MRLLFAIAAASLVLLAAQPAAAHRGRDWGWYGGGGQSYYLRDLQRGCAWGDRWACIQMGKIIGQRREARRQYWYGNPFPRYGWYGPRWYPPPPGFYFRFEGR
jgi:hypothetical protein